ncbi:unnamed protein product [Closterium sp. Yama58-4]|nr:unnamed protein product [Closterium sp. Yama58-4]
MPSRSLCVWQARRLSLVALGIGERPSFVYKPPASAAMESSPPLLRCHILALFESLAEGDSSTRGAVGARVHVATQITVPGLTLPVTFHALHCFSLPRAARKAASDVQVWWHGLTGSSKGGGGSRQKDRPAGVACKQLQFFADPACKGRALDEVLQPQFAALRRFFHVPSSKRIPRWASVSCKSEITCQQATCPINSTCMPTSDGKGVTCQCNQGFSAVNDTCVDLCDTVKCGPGGKCSVDADGKPFCSCNTGFKSSFDGLSCIDLCDAVKCGPGGNCMKDANGKPLCSCNTGFKASSDGLSCIDNCDAVNCGANGKCVRKENGDPTCECDADYEMPPNELRCIDSACAVLGCEPDGVCVTSADGVRSCEWNSPCGTCPSEATCKTVPAQTTSAVKPMVPYCECPSGYGMTATGCKKGLPDQVAASSLTLFRDRNARGNASKPYTFRLQFGCNQIPKEVAGFGTFAYSVDNIGGVQGCFYVIIYRGDNCDPSSLISSRSMGDRMVAQARSQGLPDGSRSISCQV